MIKRLIIILAIASLNFAFAVETMPSMLNPVKVMNDKVADIIDPPNTAALNIMVNDVGNFIIHHFYWI